MSVARGPELDIAIFGFHDLERLRSRTADRLELVDGELLVTPSPGTDHQRVTRRLFRLIDDAIIESGRGETFFAPLDVVLDAGTIVVPDVLVMLDDRASLVTAAGVEGAPSQVVEVVSPTSRRADAVVKRDRYARASVPEYWLLDPVGKQAIRYSDPVDGVFRNVLVLNHDDTLASATIETLRVSLTKIFDGIGLA